MKTTEGWNLNSIQDGYGIGALASCRQAEIEQERRAVSMQGALRSAGTPHFTLQRAISFVGATAVTIAVVVMYWLG